MLPKLAISSNGEFIDPQGNIIQLRGVNLDPTVKFPVTPNQSSHEPISFQDERIDEDHSEEDIVVVSKDQPLSFINHPLPLDQVETHILRLKSLGFNCLRVPFTWESMEHEGPGVYDMEYMDYLIDVLVKIHDIDNGMYLYLDPHQDVWSRFTGGSGAPMWTLLAAGFQPSRLTSTGAAIIHNDYFDKDKLNLDDKYLKMLWTTNYYKLACQTMFTLFFGGKKFAPECVINGVNIEEYLQDKLFDTILTFYDRIKTKAPQLFDDNCIIGLESLNEPNHGFIGEEHLNKVSSDRKLKLGTTPTCLQSFILGEGLDCTVEYYDIKVWGPSKQGTKHVKSNKLTCWLSQEERDVIDTRYGWTRGGKWSKHYGCIWRLHDVWRFDFNKNVQLLKPNYFHIDTSDESVINERTFINKFFMNYYTRFYQKFREVDNERFIILQPPVLKEPPNHEEYPPSIIDDKTIYACHYYDGFSLMFKTWNEYFNVDTVNIMRGKSPVTSLSFGETRIRNSFKNQLYRMKQEIRNNIGKQVGIIFSEIGMPFDMNDKKSYYKERPKLYLSQLKALDAIMYALEGNHLSFSLWCYCHENNHEWGDNWNNEDFSIWSKEDMDLNVGVKESIEFINVQHNGITIEHEENKEIMSMSDCCFDVNEINYDGIRCLASLLRPFPLRIYGYILKNEFTTDNNGEKKYRLAIKMKNNKSNDVANGNGKKTYIFLPQYHFPLSHIKMKYSSGQLTYHTKYQVLGWDHETKGLQYIEISYNESDDNVNNDKIKTNDDSNSRCIIT